MKHIHYRSKSWERRREDEQRERKDEMNMTQVTGYIADVFEASLLMLVGRILHGSEFNQKTFMKIRISLWLALISSFHVLVRYLDGKDCWRQTMNWARNRLFSLLLPAITDKAGSRSEDFSSYISAAFKGLASLAKSALFSAVWNTNFFKTCRDGAQAVSALLFRLSKYLMNSYICTLICTTYHTSCRFSY